MSMMDSERYNRGMVHVRRRDKTLLPSSLVAIACDNNEGKPTKDVTPGTPHDVSFIGIAAVEILPDQGGPPNLSCRNDLL